MNMKTADIIKAYVRIREIDNTIPDDVLDFMKQSAINTLSHSSLPSDWTSQCSCNPDDKTGETWCCNTCGKPTPRLSTELPSDEEKPTLQPLPEEIPYGFVKLFNETHTPRKIWEYVIKYFGTQPREWWMDLKKGDKVLYRYTPTGYTQTFIWDGVAEMRDDGEWYLWDDKSTLHNVKYCSPYTASPLDQLISTFTDEQKALWDQVKEGKDE